MGCLSTDAVVLVEPLAGFGHDGYDARSVTQSDHYHGLCLQHIADPPSSSHCQGYSATGVGGVQYCLTSSQSPAHTKDCHTPFSNDCFQSARGSHMTPGPRGSCMAVTWLPTPLFIPGFTQGRQCTEPQQCRHNNPWGRGPTAQHSMPAAPRSW